MNDVRQNAQRTCWPLINLDNVFIPTSVRSALCRSRQSTTRLLIWSAHVAQLLIPRGLSCFYIFTTYGVHEYSFKTNWTFLVGFENICDSRVEINTSNATAKLFVWEKPREPGSDNAPSYFRMIRDCVMFKKCIRSCLFLILKKFYARFLLTSNQKKHTHINNNERTRVFGSLSTTQKFCTHRRKIKTSVNIMLGFNLTTTENTAVAYRFKSRM